MTLQAGRGRVFLHTHAHRDVYTSATDILGILRREGSGIRATQSIPNLLKTSIKINGQADSTHVC